MTPEASGRGSVDAPPPSPALSVVIPAYNEASRSLANTIAAAAAFLQQHVASFEFVIVDDGSSDNTLELLRRLQDGCPSVRAIRLEPNQGKGAAVQAGLAAARGELVLCMDADLATPMDQLLILAGRVREGADLAIASRGLPDSRLDRRESFFREWSGRLYNHLAQWLVLPGIWDTQCGFKLFRGAVARAIAPALTEPRYAFDIEMIYLAKLSGFTVDEVPVRWSHQPGSRIQFVRDGLSMLAGLYRIWLRKSRGDYRPAATLILSRYWHEIESIEPGPATGSHSENPGGP